MSNRNGVRSFARVTARRVGLAVLFLGMPGMALTTLHSQDAPPPRGSVKKSPTPSPKGKGGGGGGGGSAPAGPAQAILLIDADMDCTVTIDNETTHKIKGNSSTKITVAQGEHMLKAVSTDGRRKLEQVVKAGGGQIVVPLKLLTAAASTAPEDFDRAAARAWTSLTDLRVMGSFIDSLWKKSFFFHDRGITAAFHTAGQVLQRDTDEFKKYVPDDEERQRVFDEINKLAPQGAKYVETITGAITAAQNANSTMGEPTNSYGQAQAILATLSVSAEAAKVMKDSAAFRDALPPDVRPRLGLSPDARDLRLGSDYAQSVAQMLATVEKGGLTDGMGFRPGDRILSVGGQPINSVWEFKQALKSGGSGRKLDVVYERDGKQEKKEVKAP